MDAPSHIVDAVARLKAAFLEIPGTQLSLVHASRLSGLEQDTCGIVLAALEDARFLRRAPNGLFICRGSDSPLSD
jgi:hypothetical protein